MTLTFLLGSIFYLFAGSDATESGKYRLIVVDGGDTSGERESMVVVDVGYGKRDYWAYTNKYGQLAKVVAKEITLQNGKTEPLIDGRYYKDEAKVSGTERNDLDQGHVIADSLGGVSNAYNITPQDSVLNRHGDQAYMEKNIRDAGGCTDFVAIITYPNSKTQIPSHYKFSYKLKGKWVVDEFDNVNPDEVNLKAITSAKPKTPTAATQSDKEKLKTVDKNNDGKVTIAEAKSAGYKMPIKKGDWLYIYMNDADGDGLVGK